MIYQVNCPPIKVSPGTYISPKGCYKANVQPVGPTGFQACIDIYQVYAEKDNLIFFMDNIPCYKRKFAVSDDGVNVASAMVDTLNNLSLQIYVREGMTFTEQKIAVHYNASDVAYFGKDIMFVDDFNFKATAKVQYVEDNVRKTGQVEFSYRRINGIWMFMGESQIVPEIAN